MSSPFHVGDFVQLDCLDAEGTDDSAMEDLISEIGVCQMEGKLTQEEAVQLEACASDPDTVYQIKEIKKGKYHRLTLPGTELCFPGYFAQKSLVLVTDSTVI